MTVCYFGYFDPTYSRNRNLIKGLRSKGVNVVECGVRLPMWEFRPFYLAKKFLRTCRKVDCIIVGFPGHTDVPLAWLLAKIFRKKVVFDAFISLYNTAVYDRKYFSPSSWHARYYYFLDWLGCRLADKVLLDTATQIKYFSKTFKIPAAKFVRILVTVDPGLFRLGGEKNRAKTPIVGFHGSYLPLQGTEYIIKSAHLLRNKNIKFRLLGNGLDFKKCQNLARKLKLKNVEFLQRVPYEKLASFISSADIYLGGPFGDNVKSKMVIPNKVVEAISLARPTVVGDTPAINEMFTHKRDCYIVDQASEKEIALAIETLLKDPTLRKKIAGGGHYLFTQYFSLDKVSGELMLTLNSL